MPTRTTSTHTHERLFLQGERARRKSRFPAALQLYRQARRTAKTAHSAEYELDAQLGVGDCLRMMAQYGQARRAYEGAGRVAAQL